MHKHFTILLTALILITIGLSQALAQVVERLPEQYHSVLLADDTPSNLRVPVPFDPATATRFASIGVTFDNPCAPATPPGCPAPGDPLPGCYPKAAQDVMLLAANIWSVLLDSSVPITISSEWLTQVPGVLASAGPNFIVRDFPGAQVPATWFTEAGANAQAGFDLVPGSIPDGVVNLGERDDWYCGFDGNTPAGLFDMLTVALHEMAHVLGNLDFMFADNDLMLATNRLVGFAGIYDKHLREAAGPLSATNMRIWELPDLTTELYNEMTDGTMAFHGEALEALGSANAKTADHAPAHIYSPTTYQAGSSHSHLDDAIYDGTSNALMTHALARGESIHDIGKKTSGIFCDIGWNVNGTNACTATVNPLLPVELASFDAIADGKSVDLTWTTLSEANNAGFEIEYRRGNTPFVSLGFVDGHGTTSEAQNYSFTATGLLPGKQVFRLKQIDFDGSFEYSPEVEVTIGTPEGYFLESAYPNPFNPSTQFTLTVERDQQVQVNVYNAVGQYVQTLHSGLLSANDVHTIRFDAGSLPSGVYIVRVQGESFVTAQKVALMK